MNVLLLSAGFGTRLRPLTNKTPKCLMELGNQVSILEFWLDKLSDEIKPEQVIVNTHYLSSQVKEKVDQLRAKYAVTLFHEPEILGTAGTIRALSDHLTKFNSCMVIHCDNYLEDDLGELFRMHERRGKNIQLTAGCFLTNDASKYGIFKLGADGTPISFVEKPKAGGSGVANAAVYCLSSELVDYIKLKPGNDLSINILPMVAKKTQLHYFKGDIIDIGTYENLMLAREKFNAK